MSVSRTAARIRKPTSRSVRLPRRWPYWSLIGLKRSRSTNSSDSVDAVAVDELQLAVERLVEVAEVVERRHLVGDRQLARLLEEPHVLERERHGVGERLQPRERRLVEAPPAGGAEGEHADRALARAEREERVGAQPLLEQAHVLEVAVLVDEVALQHRPVVEGHEARAAAHDREHAAEAPGRCPRGGSPSRCSRRSRSRSRRRGGRRAASAASSAAKAGTIAAQLAAGGDGGRDAPQRLGARRRRAQLGVEAHVVEPGADLLAEHLEQLAVEALGASPPSCSTSAPSGGAAGAQRRAGEPAGAAGRSWTSGPSCAQRPRAPARAASAGSGGEVVLGGLRRARRPRRRDEDRAAGEVERAHDVLERRAQQARPPRARP